MDRQYSASSIGAFCVRESDLLSKDHSAEFKQRFADRYAAVIDRIVHHGRLVQFRGESHRVRHALIREG